MRAWDFGSGCLTSDPVSGGQCPPGATDPFLTTCAPPPDCICFWGPVLQAQPQTQH